MLSGSAVEWCHDLSRAPWIRKTCAMAVSVPGCLDNSPNFLKVQIVSEGCSLSRSASCYTYLLLLTVLSPGYTLSWRNGISGGIQSYGQATAPLPILSIFLNWNYITTVFFMLSCHKREVNRCWVVYLLAPSTGCNASRIFQRDTTLAKVGNNYFAKIISLCQCLLSYCSGNYKSK
jgi:hypothetical protein